MSATVIQLPKLHSTEPVIDEVIVKHLEEALAEAREGKIHEMALVKVYNGGHRQTVTYGKRTNLMGAIEEAKLELFLAKK